MQRVLLSLAFLALALSCAHADYEYRYLEGEAFTRGETEGLREEGFTSWMGHPSGGKVEVFGRPAGGFLEYDIEGLQAGEYTIQVRCLAIPTTRTRTLWDGQELGVIRHDGASTSLRWSLPLGPVTIGAAEPPAKHVLRLQGSDNTGQWPYIDVILITNANGYVPPAPDQDFVSYRTPWPLLELKGEQGSQFVAPLPPEQPVALEVEITGLAMPLPVIGSNSLQATLKSARDAQPGLSATVGGGTPAVRQVPLTANTPSQVTLPVQVTAAGAARLTVAAQLGATSRGVYPLSVPQIVRVAMDEAAYPATQRAGRWSATFTCAPELLPKLSVDLTLKDLQSGKIAFRKTLPVKTPQLDVPFDLVGLSIGRFQADAAFRLGGQLAQSDAREFIKYQPAAFPVFEPVREAKALGDVITMNGKPFLARMLYHAGATDEIANHGFNLLQCWGNDPDPIPGIQKLLDDCQKAGIYGAVALFNVAYINRGKDFDLQHLEEVVLKFKDHPAVLCWDLIDEPDGQGMEPPAVQAAAELIRRLDPKHFVWVNLCQYPRASDYLASQDLWSYDYYPFPQMTPFDFRRWLNVSDRDIIGKRPMGTCLQTFNYNLRDQRMPTPDELRTSMWLHVIHGYKWFGYYSYYDGEPAGCLARVPELFSYTRALNTEMVKLEHVILAPGQWQDVATEPKTDKLEVREKAVNGKLYVVAVSDSRAPVTVTLKPSWANAKRRLLIEREMKPVAGPFTVTLRPTATQVWEMVK